MVVLAGPINEIRSMITGRYRLPKEKRVMTRRSPAAGCSARSARGAGAAARRLRPARRRARASATSCSAPASGCTYARAAADQRRDALAREFDAADMSPVFRTNGNTHAALGRLSGAPRGRLRRLAAASSTAWSARPLALSLAQLRRLPARTQITRHDCVEGWSAIGKWTGVPLEAAARQAPACGRRRATSSSTAPTISAARALLREHRPVDAFHPQTILAWGMNDRPLPVGHGAPLRLRVERQLGYKHAKFVMRIEAVASLAGIGRGKGGYWEDAAGYEWYAGI